MNEYWEYKDRNGDITRLIETTQRDYSVYILVKDLFGNSYFRYQGTTWTIPQGYKHVKLENTNV